VRLWRNWILMLLVSGLDPLKNILAVSYKTKHATSSLTQQLHFWALIPEKWHIQLLIAVLFVTAQN
jgi:hypothetical protein